MTWKIALALATATALAWFCSWHQDTWGPFRTLTDCQEFNAQMFAYGGVCHFEF